MSRINTNVQSLIAQRVLGSNNFSLNKSLERLSTGLRINRGKDDPAGLIASENLRSEKASLNAAINNAERADQVANIAEGGLQEVSGLLTELQGLITNTANTAGLSTQEKAANQLQIDSILQTIDRISSSTSFQGKKLLNGNLNYTATNVNGGVTDFSVNGAKLTTGGTIDVNAIVTTSAQRAGLVLSTGGALDLAGSSSSFTIEITGSLGSRELSFASGTTDAAIAAAINTFTDVTGVEASSPSSGIILSSSEFGSNSFVTVRVVNDAGISGTGVGIYNLTADDYGTPDSSSSVAYNSTAAGNGIRDTGQDIVATINGISATADGKTARVNTDFLDVSITFDDATAQARASVAAFTIDGGGADFQLAGQVDIAGKVSIGIADVATRKLGNTTLGYLSDLANGRSKNVVDGNLTAAQKVVNEAIDQVSSLRGRLGAFQKNNVGATIRSLSVSLENTTAAESTIRDADFATETAALTRNQILVSASTNILALANQQPQAALQLLG
ncbi:MAG: flagellin [Planctomycetaceae bacterium]|nr:flagellin [Planctomycetaceae bacterium]